jgi:chaperonin GroEL (HSP60 family)
VESAQAIAKSLLNQQLILQPCSALRACAGLRCTIFLHHTQFAQPRLSGAQRVLDGIKGTGDETIGVVIVRRALEEPIRTIAQNAGVEGSIVVARVKASKEKNFGYNGQTDTYEGLVKAGVIDPTKVSRTGLQNAASIAGLLLTTECVVVEG